MESDLIAHAKRWTEQWTAAWDPETAEPIDGDYDPIHHLEDEARDIVEALAAATDHQTVLDRIARAFDRGTGPDGWDIGIMEEVWSIFSRQNMLMKCPTCHQERAIASGEECPYAEWHEAHWDDEEEEDDDDDEAAGG